MKKFNLSFIITLYNTKIEDIKIMLDSFKEHIHEFEFIFVDDFSIDKQAINYIKTNYSQNNNFVLKELTSNTKRVGAFIEGIGLASGKYIHSLDSDDFVKIEPLLKVNKILNNNIFDTIFFPFFIKRNDELKTIGANYGKKKKGKIKTHSKILPWGITAYNFAVRREMAQECVYDKSLKGPHDDAYFPQVWLNKSKLDVVISIPWFVYVQKENTFSGHDLVSLNLLNHFKLVEAIRELIIFEKEITFQNFDSILRSHISAMLVDSSFKEVQKWLDDYINNEKNYYIFHSEQMKRTPLWTRTNGYKIFNAFIL